MLKILCCLAGICLTIALLQLLIYILVLFLSTGGILFLFALIFGWIGTCGCRCRR